MKFTAEQQEYLERNIEMEGLYITKVKYTIYGDVCGHVRGNVGGNVWGDVGGNVWGTVNGEDTV